jgi:peptidoglycan/LPS O-acetylase OafA/YrhL
MLSGTSTEKPHLPSRTGRGYLPQLDAPRFFAILGVLMAHEWRAKPFPWIFGGLNRRAEVAAASAAPH